MTNYNSDDITLLLKKVPKYQIFSKKKPDHHLLKARFMSYKFLLKSIFRRNQILHLH
jgi:hypothetical protein